MEEIYTTNNHFDRGNCSTVIFGKDASVTGKVILGHNEDDTDCVVQTHLVPRIKHAEGDTIRFDDGSAVIPQVAETNAYYWSEVRCLGGISFADGYVNEYGVAIVSNACRPSKDAFGITKDNRTNYGIGYALRRLVAERAKTAREGVRIAAELVMQFGYCSARSYQICDKDEAWVLQVPKGFNCVAKRVPDGDVYYMPNHFTIHQVHPEDTENYFVTPGLIPFAIEQGWYKPAVDGDYSDFDFAKVYQADGSLREYNVDRAKAAWKILKDADLTEENIRVFSMPADRKYSSDDAKKVLRCHYEGMEKDRTEGGTVSPHVKYDDPSSICNKMTVESMVVEFNEDINLTRMLRAAPKPCLAPYTPWYPVALTKIPTGYEWLDGIAALTAHFAVGTDELKYDPSKAWFGFKTLQYLTDFNWKATASKITASISEMEKAWEVEKDGVEAGYLELKKVSEIAAKQFLSDYTCAQAQKSWDWALETVDRLQYEFTHTTVVE